jgi:hypothetical protein
LPHPSLPVAGRVRRACRRRRPRCAARTETRGAVPREREKGREGERREGKGERGEGAERERREKERGSFPRVFERERERRFSRVCLKERERGGSPRVFEGERGTERGDFPRVFEERERARERGGSPRVFGGCRETKRLETRVLIKGKAQQACCVCVCVCVYVCVCVCVDMAQHAGACLQRASARLSTRVSSALRDMEARDTASRHRVETPVARPSASDTATRATRVPGVWHVRSHADGDGSPGAGDGSPPAVTRHLVQAAPRATFARATCVSGDGPPCGPTPRPRRRRRF